MRQETPMCKLGGYRTVENSEAYVPSPKSFNFQMTYDTLHTGFRLPYPVFGAILKL